MSSLSRFSLQLNAIVLTHPLTSSSLQECLAHVRTLRRVVSPNASFTRQLVRLEQAIAAKRMVKRETDITHKCGNEAVAYLEYADKLAQVFNHGDRPPIPLDLKEGSNEYEKEIRQQWMGTI